MRWLILNTDYPEFLRWLYAEHPELGHKPYDEQMRVRMDSLFGVADFYSNNLCKLGHEAWDIHVNNEALQRAWAAERNISLPPPRLSLQFRLRRGVMPWASVAPDQGWTMAVLAAQIKHYKPDVILNQDLRAVGGQFLKQAGSSVQLVIGQCAAPLAKTVDLNGYDLMLSSLPNFVERFRSDGLKAELHRFGFEPRILELLDQPEQMTDASFVGTLSRDHQTRVALVEHLCRSTPLLVWGQGAGNLARGSSIRRRHQGKAWGKHMYQILRDSRVTLNHHIGVAEQYANNMRLYEATGAGALLVTDWKQNLQEMFEPGKEVITYRSPIECAELIEYYLGHETERASIARAGQQRTLREHTYERRMQELVEIVSRYIQ
jgi:hypothetical protein